MTIPEPNDHIEIDGTRRPCGIPHCSAPSHEHSHRHIKTPETKNMEVNVFFSIDKNELSQLADETQIMSGVVIGAERVIILALKNYRLIIVPFATFPFVVYSDGYQGVRRPTPDFTRPSIRDFGYTLALGEFEVYVDALVADADAKIKRQT